MVAPTSLPTDLVAYNQGDALTAKNSGNVGYQKTVHGAVNELTALGLRVLMYTSGAYPTRPAGVPAGLCKYVGPSQPSDWLAGDEWVNNS